jgi:hypothetical protein
LDSLKLGLDGFRRSQSLQYDWMAPRLGGLELEEVPGQGVCGGVGDDDRFEVGDWKSDHTPVF